MLYKLAPLNGLCDRLKHVAEYSIYAPNSILLWCPTDSCPARWDELFAAQPDGVMIEDVTEQEYRLSKAAKCQWFENPDAISERRGRAIHAMLPDVQPDIMGMVRFQDRHIGLTSVHVRRGEWDTRIPPKQIKKTWLDMDREGIMLVGENVCRGETLALYSDQADVAVAWLTMLRCCYNVIPPDLDEFDASKFRQTSAKRALADLIEMSRAHKIIACGPGGFSRTAAEIGNNPLFYQVDLAKFQKRLWVRDEEKAMQERAKQ